MASLTISKQPSSSQPTSDRPAISSEGSAPMSIQPAAAAMPLASCTSSNGAQPSASAQQSGVSSLLAPLLGALELATPAAEEEGAACAASRATCLGRGVVGAAAAFCSSAATSALSVSFSRRRVCLSPRIDCLSPRIDWFSLRIDWFSLRIDGFSRRSAA